MRTLAVAPTARRVSLLPLASFWAQQANQRWRSCTAETSTGAGARRRGFATRSLPCSQPRRAEPSAHSPPPHLHAADPQLHPSGRWNSQQPIADIRPASFDAAPAVFAASPLQPAETFHSAEQEARYLLSLRAPSVLRAFAFCALLAAAAFGLAAYFTLADADALARRIREESGPFGDFASFAARALGAATRSEHGVSEGQLRAAKKQVAAERYGRTLTSLVGWCDQLHLPDGVKEFVGRSYVILAESYLNLSPSKEGVVPIIALNTAVFGAFLLVPSLYPFLFRTFVHAPWLNGTRKVSTLLTSTFSHQAPVHYLFNTLALWSFGAAAFLSPAWPLASPFSLTEHRRQQAHAHSGGMLPEPSHAPHFVAFFAVAGTVAALLSHAVLAMRFRRAVRSSAAFRNWRAGPGRANAHDNAELRARLAEFVSHASLGSSGAVYAALVMAACALPDARVGIIFVPFIAFPITWGVGAMVLTDLLGVVRGWRMFDHWAHLGGAAFGAAYWYAGWGFWERVKRVTYDACFKDRNPIEQKRV
ncbi:hypothetical protein K437DRAFT_267840 [Tilletiaria anomala UBC 951]|uniref:Peptidase S54 rhomboid domain-containing protein n=1 Tax=Tilletiaria anomala (strain ATCC 24038 / CBS 436.72 / UBC 951) TaxID=1037660 RepID=A0A066W9U1_TILAU|nr:uncharacterized protein K437DRAFT_267840 [Tilletiaria anomala UBC 951]KDN47550.1 hypothetical protein K437DRAFT_267840 [Tilletiaria anomala UBC 951]